MFGIVLEQAARAQTVAELRLGVLRDVGLDLAPVAPVVADALAVRADREQAAERPPLRLGSIERPGSRGQPEHARAGTRRAILPPAPGEMNPASQVDSASTSASPIAISERATSAITPMPLTEE